MWGNTCVWVVACVWRRTHVCGETHVRGETFVCGKTHAHVCVWETHKKETHIWRRGGREIKT